MLYMVSLKYPVLCISFMTFLGSYMRGGYLTLSLPGKIEINEYCHIVFWENGMVLGMMKFFPSKG